MGPKYLYVDDDDNDDDNDAHYVIRVRIWYRNFSDNKKKVNKKLYYYVGITRVGNDNKTHSHVTSSLFCIIIIIIIVHILACIQYATCQVSHFYDYKVLVD